MLSNNCSEFWIELDDKRSCHSAFQSSITAFVSNVEKSYRTLFHVSDTRFESRISLMRNRNRRPFNRHLAVDCELLLMGHEALNLNLIYHSVSQPKIRNKIKLLKMVQRLRLNLDAFQRPICSLTAEPICSVRSDLGATDRHSLL